MKHIEKSYTLTLVHEKRWEHKHHKIKNYMASYVRPAVKFNALD